MQPIWSMPPSSYAQNCDFGIPFFIPVNPSLAFQGRSKYPTTTSFTKLPSEFISLLHFQQKPAVSLAEKPNSFFSFIANSSSSGELKILNSKLSSFDQSVFAVLLICKVLSIQFV